MDIQTRYTKFKKFAHRIQTKYNLKIGSFYNVVTGFDIMGFEDVLDSRLPDITQDLLDNMSIEEKCKQVAPDLLPELLDYF